MPEDVKTKPYLTPTEVAQWMMVSPITVRAWASKGMLAAEVTPGGHRRFRREEVERFMRQSNSAPANLPLKVLVVDDDKALVGYLTELLDGLDKPVQVEAALDGFDAGRKVHAFSPDIVLLDLMMPGVGGVEVCRAIRSVPALAHVRIIAMSGFLSQENEALLLDAGAECCLAKPLDAHRLLGLLGLGS